VRPKINERYEALLEYLYTPEAKNIAHNKNMDSLKSLLS
jgi:hypothetical protein